MQEDDSARIREDILDMLSKRAPGKSICPSEVARNLYPGNWRDQMENVREVAREMTREGVIRITQGDDEVDPDNIKGPIRLRLTVNQWF